MQTLETLLLRQTSLNVRTYNTYSVDYVVRGCVVAGGGMTLKDGYLKHHGTNSE